MLNEERRRAIIEDLERDGRVLLADMARKFDTSQVTIRKDLEVLHAHGLFAGQLTGLYTGLRKGLDPDHPRNLSRVVVLDEEKALP